MLCTKHKNDSTNQRVHQNRHEKPPKLAFELVVKEPVFSHPGFMFVQFVHTTFQLARFGSNIENTDGEKGDETGENTKGDTCEESRCPGIAGPELVKTIECPC